MMSYHANNVRCSRHSAALIVFLVVSLLVAACDSEEAARKIAAFSTATTVATSGTADAFAALDESYYQTNIARLVVDYDERGFDPEAAQRLLPPEDVEVRLQLLRAVQLYAERMADVMSDDQLAEFDAETKSFGQSLLALKDSRVPILSRIGGARNQVGVLTTAIDALGRFFMERKRRKEVRRIISEMDAPVRAVCQHLIDDIGLAPREDVAGTGLRAQMWRQFNQQMISQDTFIRKNTFDPRTRAEEIRRLPVLVRKRAAADQMLAATQSALRKLSEAHGAISTAFERKQDVKLDRLVAELYAEGTRIKKFYDNLVG